MNIKDVFPETMSVQVEVTPYARRQLVQVSALCNALWNQVRQQGALPLAEEARTAQLEQVIASDPAFDAVPRSVFVHVFNSLRDSWQQYQQAQQDFADHRRPDQPPVPGERPTELFFPLHYSQDSFAFDQDHRLRLRNAQDPIDIELPQGDYGQPDSVLILHHPESDTFRVELNPHLYRA